MALTDGKETGAALKEPPKPKRHGMTGWYDPLILISTAIRVAISTVFGQFADKREAIAATNAIEPQPFDENFNYSAAKGDFWFDFLADTGDGWNSTYAMARLLSAPVLKPERTNEQLAQGQVLFLGGDQVYPTASKEAYAERFIAPFEQAWSPPGAGPLWPPGSRDLYAIPGNHDWYDGLNAFFGLFCRRRVKPSSGIGFERPGKVVAGRKTSQTRSYFAAQLPRGWWVWGTDSQLEGYIDQPQIDFFRHAAREWMDPGSKLILMVGQPSWAYADEKTAEAVFSNFSYLERLGGAEVDAEGKPLGHQLRLVLTGDAHHYSRFVEADRHYITCGGGGAFLHPTHHLENRRFRWDYPPPGQPYVRGETYVRDFRIARTPDGTEALYPSRARSSALTFWNLAFAGINLGFTAFFALAYFLFHWMLETNAQVAHGTSLEQILEDGSLLAAAGNYWQLVFFAPAAVILVLIALGGYYYAADAPHFWRRALMGGGHALVQALVVTATMIAVFRWLPDLPLLLELAIASLAAAVISATTYGLYLLAVLQTTGRHWNEAFSSFAHPGFKSMLRMRIDAEGRLHVYPVGLDSVPSDKGQPPRNPPLSPHLVEGPLIIS